MGKLLKWALIIGGGIAVWMFVVPASIKCKVPIFGGSCAQTQEVLGAINVDPNAMPITQLDDAMKGMMNLSPEKAEQLLQKYKSSFARPVR